MSRGARTSWSSSAFCSLERLGVLLRGPLGALPGVGGSGGEVGVVLGERAHELEPVGELGEVLGAQQHVDLGAGAGVGLDGSGLQVVGAASRPRPRPPALSASAASSLSWIPLRRTLASLYCSIAISSSWLTSCSLALAASTSALVGAADEEVTREPTSDGDHEDDGYGEPCESLGGPGHRPSLGSSDKCKGSDAVAGCGATSNEASGRVRRRQTSRVDPAEQRTVSAGRQG